MSKQINLANLFPEPRTPDVPRGPLPKQLEFLNAAIQPENPKYIRYIGGIGCLSGDSLIRTPNGPVKLNQLHTVPSLLSSSFGLYSALKSVPFPKGKDRLYRVVHEHGEFVAAGHHLVACAGYKYKRVDELTSSDQLLRECFQDQPLTSLADALLESEQDVHYLRQTHEGFLVNCLACYRRYGQLPPEVLDIAQAVLPSLIDALKYNLSPEHKDDLQELKLGRIRPDRLYSLLSTLGSFLLGEDLSVTVEDLVSSLSSESPSESNPKPEQSQYLSVFRHTFEQPENNQSYVLQPSTYNTSNVLSVSRKDTEEWYWDVHCPTFGNYVLNDNTVHHNSGKTMIGCITMITLAVMFEGDYLIGRQFYPELRDTTLKNFLELCPKELIIEYRVADAIVVLKNAQGTRSNVLFRALEEPDKLRSLNLNAFYIDESCQVSEAAFLLLQGRLRGKHVRKGFLTTNSDGRSWGWRYFVQKSMFKTEKAKQLFLDIKAPSTENKHLPPGYVETMLESWSQARIDREIMADEETFEGAIYPEFRRDTHVIKPFKIPDDWPRIVGADHGFRNPACWLWGAIDYDGTVYIYKEYYEREKKIEDICKDVTKLNGSDNLKGIYIDPSIKRTAGQTGISDWTTYVECLPKNFHLYPANNEVNAGIDKVKTYLKSDSRGRPSLYIFDTCENLLNEIGEYRWAPMTEVQLSTKNAREEPRKYNDHAVDSLRYLIMTRPDKAVRDSRTKLDDEWNTPKTSIQLELQRLRKPKEQDPFQDF